MANGFYLVLAIAVGVAGIFYGFWRGISGQLGAVLGFAFGIVCARVFTPDLEDFFKGFLPFFVDSPYIDYAINVFSASALYVVPFLFFSLFSGIFRLALSVFEKGILNRIVGAVFGLTASLLLVSIAYTLILCVNPDCGLLKYERSDDGNMATVVMSMTPAFLGCDGADEFAYLVQLQQAKTISCNFNDSENVIIKKELSYSDVKDKRS